MSMECHRAYKHTQRLTSCPAVDGQYKKISLTLLEYFFSYLLFGLFLNLLGLTLLIVSNFVFLLFSLSLVCVFFDSSLFLCYFVLFKKFDLPAGILKRKVRYKIWWIGRWGGSGKRWVRGNSDQDTLNEKKFSTKI